MAKYRDNSGGGAGVLVPLKYRKYVYSIMLAIAPIAIAYGIVTDSEAGLWLSLVGAVLGAGNTLALVNTPPAKAVENADH